MRIAILGDTHGVLDAGIAGIVATCDWAVHTGDVGSAAVLSGLRPRLGRVVAVRGNNDVAAKWPAEDHHLLARLPAHVCLKLPGGPLVIDHGHGANPAPRRHALLRRRYPEARAIAYGHSHRLVLDHQESPWVLNPGAAGRSRTFGGPSCIVMTVMEQCWLFEVRRFPVAKRGG